MGLVSQVFDETALNALQGHLAIGTAATRPPVAATWENAQPTLGPTAAGTVALGHNGNLTNTAELVDPRRRALRQASAAASSPGATPPTPR